MTETAEKNQTLWLLVAAPAMWAAHFVLSYITVSIWCAKFAGESMLLARTLVAAYTAVALMGIGLVLWIGHRRRSHEEASKPTDHDSPGARHRFLGFATLLLAGLSAIATMFVALAALFISTCY